MEPKISYISTMMVVVNKATQSNFAYAFFWEVASWKGMPYVYDYVLHQARWLRFTLKKEPNITMMTMK